MAGEYRLGRLLRIITLLQARTLKGINDLKAELEVSERTAFRDLKALSLAGVPVRHDREDGGYRIAGDFFLPPVQLTLAEAMALSVLGSQVAKQRQLPFLEDAWRAVAKVRGQLPASIRDEVASLDGHVSIHEARVSPQQGCDAHFRTMQQAISRTRKVLCRYQHGDDNAEQRFLFRPYSLFFCQRAWYAIGHSELRGEERSLKLNRLAEATLTDRPYGIPPDWSLERSLGKAWRMIRGDRRYAVTIRFDHEFGRSMADTLWHPTQTIAWQPDGSCLFRCEVDGLDEIVWWVLGYGPHAEVLTPIELRSKVCDTVASMSQKYGLEADEASAVGR